MPSMVRVLCSNSNMPRVACRATMHLPCLRLSVGVGATRASATQATSSRRAGRHIILGIPSMRILVTMMEGSGAGETGRGRKRAKEVGEARPALATTQCPLRSLRLTRSMKSTRLTLTVCCVPSTMLRRCWSSGRF